MKRITILKERQAKLKNDITTLLDSFIIGSVNKAPSMHNYNLTRKVNRKTKSVTVHENISSQALSMSANHKKLKSLIQAVSMINWEILNLENIPIKPKRKKLHPD